MNYCLNCLHVMKHFKTASIEPEFFLFPRSKTLPSLFCERVDFGTEIVLNSYAARR